MVRSSSDRNRGVRLTDDQKTAIGKWRWLGWRGSTPAFKASIALLAAVAFALIAYWAVVIEG